MNYRILLFLIIVSVYSCDRTDISNKKAKKTSVIKIDSISNILSGDNNNKELVFKKACDLDAEFYYHHYREIEFSKNETSRRVLIDPFNENNWESFISKKYKLKSKDNVLGLDSIDMPCGGDFDIPVVYSSYTKADKSIEKFNYYILSERGISMVYVDSMQASVMYVCFIDGVDEKTGFSKQSYNGNKSYFGNLLGKVKDTTSFGGVGFAFRSRNNIDYSIIGIKSIVIDDIISVNKNSIYEEELYNYIENSKKENYNWIITDEDDKEYLLVIPIIDQGYSLIGPNSVEDSYVFNIGESKYLFTTWINDICGNYYVLYSIDCDKLTQISVNEYNCGF